MSKQVKDETDKKIDYDICCAVGRIYMLANNTGYKMKEFSNMFLASDFCKRAFDTTYSVFQLEDEYMSMDYLLKEVNTPMEDKDIILTEDEAFFIGFIYRYIYIQTLIPSSVLVSKIPYDYLLNNVYRIIALDEEYAFEIICKDCKIDIER